MFSKNDDLREAVTRYEKMLLEHETIFFDSYQYEDIILYYLEYAKYAKAKQALEVALSQYPTASACYKWKYSSMRIIYNRQGRFSTISFAKSPTMPRYMYSGLTYILKKMTISRL